MTLLVVLVWLCVAFVACVFVNDEIRRHTIKKNSASVRETLTADDVFMRNIPSVRETYGRSACTCDSATCKGAHWKHWGCPSPDMDVLTWERMKLSHVRPVSSAKARRSVRVHSVAALSVFSG